MNQIQSKLTKNQRAKARKRMRLQKILSKPNDDPNKLRTLQKKGAKMQRRALKFKEQAEVLRGTIASAPAEEKHSLEEQANILMIRFSELEAKAHEWLNPATEHCSREAGTQTD